MGTNDEKRADMNVQTPDGPEVLVRVSRCALEDILRENRELSERCDELMSKQTAMILERRSLAGLQEEVAGWVQMVFGADAIDNLRERARRFLEEALELAQACGVTEDEVDLQLRHVYGGKPGTFAKELADAQVTLFALAATLRIDMFKTLKKHLAVMHTSEEIDRVRSHQVEKTAAGLTSH